MNSATTPETAIQFSNTVEDLITVQVQKFSKKEGGTSTRIILFINFFLLMLGIDRITKFLYDDDPDSTRWLLLGFALGVGLLAAWWFTRSPANQLRQGVKELMPQQGEGGEFCYHTLQIREEGLIAEAANIRTIYRWNNSFTINSYDLKGGRLDEIAVGNGLVGHIIIPVHNIQSGDYQAFLDQLRHVSAEQSLRFKPITFP